LINEQSKKIRGVSSQHDVVGVENTARFFGPFMSVGEDVPESQSFITRPRYYGASVRAHRQVKYSVGVAREGGSLLHLGILPDVDLVLRVSVGTDKFIQSLAEHQVADLGTNVHGFDGGSRESVSKFDCSISSSSS
jgi:hypothetical protein